MTTRSYKNYDHDTFIEDLANVPFHIVNLFDDPDDQVHAFNCLFQYVLNNHAPIKQIKIHSRPNPFVSTEIKGLMNTRDMWHKKAMKTNDKLHWNRHFRQEVKREIRLAEKEHVRSEIQKSNGNTNSIWKVLNRYIPRKNTPLATVENPLLLANEFNEFHANVSTMTALKATKLSEEHNFNIHYTEGFDPCESDRNSCPNNTPLFAFQPITTGDVHKLRLLRVYLQIKLPVVIELTPKS